MTIEELMSIKPRKEYPDNNCHREEGLILTEIFYATPLQVIVFAYSYGKYKLLGKYDCVNKFLELESDGCISVDATLEEPFVRIERSTYNDKELSDLISTLKDVSVIMKWIPDIKKEILDISVPYNVQ